MTPVDYRKPLASSKYYITAKAKVVNVFMLSLFHKHKPHRQAHNSFAGLIWQREKSI